MPAGILIEIALRSVAKPLLAYQIWATREWLPRFPRTRQCKPQPSYYSDWYRSAAQKRECARPDHEASEEFADDFVSAPQSKATVDELHRRLRFPKRRRGYEGDNIRPKQPKAAPKSTVRSSSTGDSSHGSSPTAAYPHQREKLRWQNASTRALEEELSITAHNDPSVRTAQSLLHILISSRGVKPSALHYEALILAQCDAELGSVSAVEAVLGEMERENIAIGLSVYIAALKVLAIHPSPLLRTSLLNTMSSQWMLPHPTATEYTILGLIREGQLELALQQIQSYKRTSQLPPYIHSLLLYKLCEVEDFDAVLQLLYALDDHSSTPMSVPTYTAHHLLDRAAECLHGDLTGYIWRKLVQPPKYYIMPSTGLCYNALLTAARAGDTWLAESVCKVLGMRQERLSVLEWDLLEEAYETKGDGVGTDGVRERRKLQEETGAVEGERRKEAISDS